MSHKQTSKFTSKGKNTKKPPKTLKLTPCDSNDALELPTKKYRAGSMLSNPPMFDLTKDDTILPNSQGSAGPSRSSMPTGHCQRHSADVKGKNKETGFVDEGSLWVDKYEPTSEAELAVHKRKVEDVRRWLLEAFEGGPSAKLRKYRRILALTGPAGTAKTSTLRVLSKELDFEILEWRNSMSERGPSTLTMGEPPDEGLDFATETLFDKFQAFLTRSTTCNAIFGHRDTTQRHSEIQSSTQHSGKRRLILLEDLPNLIHEPTQARFQAALRSLCIPTANSSGAPGPPIVLIVSDSGVRAEQPDDDIWEGGSNGRRWNRKEVLDIRNVLGPELLTSPYVTRIGFNPIAPTLMTKALQALLASHFGSLETQWRAGKQPSREVIDIIVASSNGDIRSAIMALQFACVVDLPASSAKSKGKVARKNVGGATKTTNVRAVLEAVTRREQSLILFHLMGKILYNKRKFDPPASHLSAKDATKERELDVQLVDQPPLPVWLSHHDRKTSRVCPETLAAESPIDASLLGLYTHQNYTQFCTEIDQCDGVCEGLSWVDYMSGAHPAATNSPYAFPTLTISTLHALPIPVPRRGQKVCKPTWFDVRSREIEASDAVGDVLRWLGRGGGVGGGWDADIGASAGAGADTDAERDPVVASMGKWTHVQVATELGGWLRGLDRRCGAQEGPRPQPPRTHRTFSYLSWSLGTVGGDVLGEHEDGEVEGDGDEDVRLPGGMRGGDEGNGWLEDDDIEEVE